MSLNEPSISPTVLWLATSVAFLWGVVVGHVSKRF